MHKETKLTSDINTNKKISVTCRSCKNETKHIILKDVHIDGQYGEEYYGEWQTLVDWQEDYQIVQCLGCENITFRNISSNSTASLISGVVITISPILFYYINLLIGQIFYKHYII